MNQKWKEKVQHLLQDWKNDPKIVHAVKMLVICIIVVIIYALAAYFNLGAAGLILRVICAVILVYILYQVYKSE